MLVPSLLLIWLSFIASGLSRLDWWACRAASGDHGHGEGVERGGLKVSVENIIHDSHLR